MPEAVTVRAGLPLKEVVGREIVDHRLPTMADTGDVDLRGFLRAVYRRKWLLVVIMAVAIGATMYWMLHTTPLYSADVLIVVETRPSSIVRVDEAVQDVVSDTVQVNTEVAVLESRNLAARVIDDLELDRDPEFARPQPGAGRAVVGALEGIPAFLLSLWTGDDRSSAPGTAAEAREDGQGAREAADPQPPVAPSVAAAALQRVRTFLESVWAGVDGNGAPGSAEDAGEDGQSAHWIEDTEARDAAALLDRFLARLSIEAEEDSRLIRIGFTSADPAKAALIANRIVDEYIESRLETKTEGARRAAQWLEARLAELGETVRSLEQSVERQRTDTGVTSVDIVSQRLSQLNSQLVDAQAATASAAARHEQVRAVLERGDELDALPAVIASSAIQALRTRNSELVGTLSELQTVYGARHPRIIAVRAEITEVERRLSREINNVLAGLRNEVEGAEIREAAIRRDLNVVTEEMARLKKSEASIGQLALRSQTNQDLYQNLLERYTEAVALRDNQQPDARVISPAQMPLEPSYPNFPRVIVLSFVGSASLALLLLVITERLRQKLDTVEDVEQQVGVPVVGTIPDLPRLRRLAAAPGDYMRREPLSEFGGAFQRLRALLTLSNRRVMPRTVLVTSCADGEGKTTIAVCLGIASISSGQKVLLVDCDFARPQVHRMLGVQNVTGLTDILKGTATPQEAIIRTAGSSLSILTIGRSADGAIDLLSAARMEKLLAELRRSFDIIILDSAPVEVSNALILGGLAEKTIFVIRREWTSRRDASYALKQLELYGADIAGVVFNRAGATTSYASRRFR